MESRYNLDQWCEENKHMFDPPVCNKLMHKDQLSIMFVGGPNRRKDFHLEDGSEFFFQLKGNMELPTVQRGKRKLVEIKEGQVFLLKSNIPHSPQRPEAGSLGLVVERSRTDDEYDALRFYTDFEKCDRLLWERFFHCYDLGRDLVPVVTEFMKSEEAKTMEPKADSVPEKKLVVEDTETELPDPFDFWPWVEAHRAELDAGHAVNLFEGHPCKEFSIHVVGGPSEQQSQFAYETWLWQLKGAATVTIGGKAEALFEGECCIIKPNTPYHVQREAGSLGMVVTQNPHGNKKGVGAREE